MEFIKKLTDKSWLRSKTQWIAFVFGVFGAAVAFYNSNLAEIIPADWAILIGGVIMNINNVIAFINRFFTTTGIWVKEPPAGTSTGIRVEPTEKGTLLPVKGDAVVEKVEPIAPEKPEIVVPAPTAEMSNEEALARYAPLALTQEQYFQFYSAQEPEHIDNAKSLIKKVNALLLYLLIKHNVNLVHKPNTNSFISGDKSGGYRLLGDPIGAPLSTHKLGLGVDITDPYGVLDPLITVEVLEMFDLYKEHQQHTPYYVHLQDKAPGSGVRIYTI